MHTNADKFVYTIERDGGEVEEVVASTKLSGMQQKTREDAYSAGTGWKESFRLSIPRSWKSGVYVVTAHAAIPDKSIARAEHFFVVRSGRPGKDANIVLMLSTGTYAAYNDWGGVNYYRSGTTEVGITHSSLLRPWARGYTRIPAEAPSPWSATPAETF